MIQMSITDLAQLIALKNGMSNFEMRINSEIKKTDGSYADIFIVTVKDEERNIELVFKSAKLSDVMVTKYKVGEVFENELNFYTKVVPAIRTFQEKNMVSHRFTAAARYFGSHFEKDMKIIALENLRARGFELFDKKATMDGEHVRMVFTHYARLHAFSFAYRDQYPEKFAKLTQDFPNMWIQFLDEGSFGRTIDQVCQEAFGKSDFGNEINEKLKVYRNAKWLLRYLCQYNGKYSAILHGDCWSNNIMFKYKSNSDESKTLEEICFIDWQVCNVGTPVYDLSFFLYSSSSKQIFDQLDFYLNIYYETLSTSLREMGSDPECLYPISRLKADWKIYSKFGFILSLLFQRMKLMTTKEEREIEDLKKGSEDQIKSSYLNSVFDRECYDERTKNLVIHMNEIGAL